MPINSFLYPAKNVPTSYEVANSCRFNDDDTAYFNKTPSAGDRAKWTFSCWFKLGNIPGASANHCLFSSGSSGADQATIKISNQKIDWWEWDQSANDFIGYLSTNRKIRDPSAWYHLVCTWDSDNGTAGNRMRMYINGTEETSFATDTNPTSGFDSNINSNVAHEIGREANNSSNYWDGYLAEMAFCDGQAYAASDFGEFDDDSPTIWKPKDISGLTFGSRGWYLDFEDSGDLDDDESGNTNDWTANNLAATDQATDTPTNNFATMNPLDNSASAATFSEGNLKLAYSGSNGSGVGLTSTFALTKGKWYFEAKLQASNDTGNSFGITDINAQSNAAANRLGVSTYSYVINDSDGKIYNNNDSGTSYGSALDVGDIIGVYLDLDNNKLYISEDGTLGSSTGHSITAASSVSNGHYFFAVGLNSGSGTSTFECNFGGCPAFSISSGNTDDNGYGNFEYSPNITGDSEAKKFYALCTKNLAEYG